MVIIVPAAGLSTRFPNLKPKYLLKDNNGAIMLKNALMPYLDRFRIIVGILKEHQEKYQSDLILREAFGEKIEIVVLDTVTKGPADTIYQIICKTNLPDSEILVKDCDSFFEHENENGNFVCVANARNFDTLFNLSAKSFVIANDQNIITDIVEKKIVSELFCVGGYKFQSSYDFVKHFQILGTGQEQFVSMVIQSMIYSGTVFKVNTVFNYYDVGTLDDWHRFMGVT